MGQMTERLVALTAGVDSDEADLILSLAKGKLDWSEKHNWVEDNGDEGRCEAREEGLTND